ncbi:MAG: insulinase family protein [bacterium]
MKQKSILMLFVLFMSTVAVSALNPREGFEQYTLENGLTVYLWEDSNAADINGRVIFRAGSVDEPSEYTGLAHYLEHVLFKGTTKIGALDWEKEEPLYKEIIALYDQLNAETDEAKRTELIKAINEKSIEAAQYGATDDFSNLTSYYGGTNLNAFTSYDLTAYHNNFPANAMEQWMELNSERLMNPVFRSFQAELENVFEEYNMYEDDLNTHQRDFMFEHFFAGSPYDRSVIGYPQHIKNPSLSALINFYETWYVPNNMALILVGDFKSEEAKPLIEKKFGRLQRKELPARTEYKDTDYSGNQQYRAKLGYNRQLMWAYPAVAKGDKDELLIEFMLSLLNNDYSTGMLDRLMLDGTVSAAYAYYDFRRLFGRIYVMGVPYYDMSQYRYESNSATRKIIFDEIEKIKNNQVPEWLFKSAKEQYVQKYQTIFESVDTKMDIITDLYTYEKSAEDFFNYPEYVKSITMEDVVACAKKYFSQDYITLEFQEGDPKKDKISKPAIKPLDPPKDAESPYSAEFKQIPIADVPYTFNNLADVTEKELFNNVNLLYTPNHQNDIFSLTLKYGVGTAKMPKLEYAASLMNSAGMLPNISAQDLRRQYSELGVAVGFSVSESYFYISLSGDEKNLDAALQLLTKHVMMPNLDDQQIRSMISGAYWSRFSEKRNSNVVSSALMEYVLFGEKSRYIDRIPMEELYKATMMNDGTVTEVFLVNKLNLTTTIQEATGYAVDIYYCGANSVDQVSKSLAAIPMKEKMVDTDSPVIRERTKYEKPNIIFLPDNKMQQAKVYFYINSEKYDIKDDVLFDAYNQYFSGGFSGIVMNEIREKRSMAYTAYADLGTSRPGIDSYLLGYVGTQPDKVAEAIDVFMSLLNDMPQYPERIEDIKTYLRQTMATSKPSMRSKAPTYQLWKEYGYTDDPSKVNMPLVDELTYDQIQQFYEARVQGRPITVIIIGDPKTIDFKAIRSAHGKETRISTNKLFKGGI